ncbi:MAG TPA: hypothetical protein DCG19_03835 [Cryomorphaceae bacterium]|nr:hypothetical protein [Owenweeksia sp.]MBF97865.1 hypothetical protein [Owenweeksia sp.]HAD96510.1 hypothetical protein [Cryomorphaceae bacterium]HBF19789.1 hypothetical protein [Cryomorphaceae bacterium]HCQ17125.1 hypothetical protein [Cryomorphaceae bacterium]|tara:strand:+ start:1033 stop:1359 length:327 start_codon:yes stop_codon:yes gene_type:complete
MNWKKVEKKVDPLISHIPPTDIHKTHVFWRNSKGTIQWRTDPEKLNVSPMTKDEFLSLTPGTKGVLLRLPDMGNLYKELKLTAEVDYASLKSFFRLQLLYTSTKFKIK